MKKWIIIFSIILMIGLFAYNQHSVLTGSIRYAMNARHFFDGYVDFGNGHAPQPIQYRMLGPRIIFALGDAGINFPQSFHVASFFVMVLLLLSLWFYYYRIGFSVERQALLLTVFMLTVYISMYDCSLYLDNNINLALMCWGMVLIQMESWLLIPLVMIGAYNRETILILPVIAALYHWDRKKMLVPALALIAGIAVYAVIRIVRGPAPDFNPYGMSYGLKLLWFNISGMRMYVYLNFAYGCIPLLALMRVNSVRPWLRRALIVVIPAWAIIHLLYAVVGESRLFLTPYALLVLPALFDEENNAKI